LVDYLRGSLPDRRSSVTPLHSIPNDAVLNFPFDKRPLRRRAQFNEQAVEIRRVGLRELGWRFGYGLALGTMAAVCSGLWFGFERSGWL
jgi:hypothetical protein